MSATAQDHGAARGDDGYAAEALAAAHVEGRRLAESGDLTGARTMLEDALAVGELQLGREHPKLAPLMVDLATIARNVGNLTEAQHQLRRAYAIVVNAAGPEHPTSLSIEGRLAAISYRLGEPTEAYDWHIAEAGPRVLGPDHPAVRGAQQRLAAAPPKPTPDEPNGGGWVPEGAPDWPPYAGGDDVGYDYPSPDAYSSGGSPGPYGYDPDDGYPAAGYSPHDYSPTDYSAPVAGRASVPVSMPVPDYPPGVQVGTNFGGYDYPYQAAEPGVYQRIHRDDDVYVIEPPPREYQPVEVWQEPPAAVHMVQKRRNNGGLVLVVSLGIAAIVAAVIVANQLLGAQSTGTPNPPAAGASSGATTAPTGDRPAPSQVVLDDKGGSITLTWADPSGGTVPFIVAGGRVGTESTPLDSVPAGKTTSTIYGLNDHFDYCFTVAAVYSSDVVVPSIRTCTRRLSTTSTP